LVSNTLNSLGSGFWKSADDFGDRPALEVAGEVVTYAGLRQKAAAIASALDRIRCEAEPPLTGVFASRSVTAFAGVLGALFHGHGYVPLNRSFPPERTRIMLQRSGCHALVVDAESAKQLDQVLQGLDRQLHLIIPDRLDVRELAERWPAHRFIGGADLDPAEQREPREVAADSIAYLLFTSGSTGTPKGVMVSNRNARHYLDFVTKRFEISRNDRFSQTFDLTFDLSVADMFVAWERGACVCCPSEKTLINPGQFIRDSGITVWFSVPSIAVFMKRLGSLRPSSYPGLRVSLFCGEALTVEIARAWEEAAPNSIVENIYGPTELTIACTYYRWDRSKSPSEAEFGVVPIGEPFPGMEVLIADESLAETKPGEPGELLMAGPQLSLGYWGDPARTAASFVRPPGRSGVYYRTGDRVRRSSAGAPLVYLGRLDNQIKILGHRVELGEVEAVVREESGIDGVVALGWPLNPGGAGGIEVFLQSPESACPDLKERTAKRLPAYMVPRRYRYLSRFPLNANGKFDRRALLDILGASQ